MRALIVEDDIPSRMFIQKIIEPYFSVHTAEDGVQAMDAFKNAFQEDDPYSIIFLDIMMPNMDGQEVLKKIRIYESEHGIGGLQGVKIIMTTALKDSGNIMKAFNAQCEAYLPKPIEKEDVLKTVRDFGLIPSLS
ncbi:response regulator [Salinispira pacifica]|uniref:Response regulator n=1 Tax=Salinispira pacifica TaxID=1307761 RepID=V5WID8_9SPIO|nr:response regulator [Salinispira pacifica]AHC15538.1 Response regulator [Salinispira pacifica]